MSISRIFAIIGIFALGCAGWATLGTTTMLRSDQLSSRLGDEVGDLWGAPIAQHAPTFAILDVAPVSGPWMEDPPQQKGKSVERLMPTSNEVEVDLGQVW